MANIYIAMEYISCLMAVNRFVAIVSWKWYPRIFSRSIVLVSSRYEFYMPQFVLFIFIVDRGHSVYKVVYYQLTIESN